MKKNLLLILLLTGGWVSNIFPTRNTYEISVRTLTGKTIRLAINKDATVADLKKALAEEVGIPAELQRIIMRNKELQENELLIEDLHVLDRPRSQITVFRRLQPSPPASPPPTPALPRIFARQAVGAALTMAALAAAVAGFMEIRAYKKTKRSILKNYRLAHLTKLQTKTWLATVLASHGVSWYLRRLVQNNEGSLTDFVGTDPRAIAELYYGHAPTANELDSFLATFFAGKE